jgi:3-hydroxyisobutyrate dehydrogenase-like beta-hydroxyacid dehydrogenase
MTKDHTIRTVALLGTGDMGHAVGRALLAHGHAVVTCLAGRGQRSRRLAAEAGIGEAADLDGLMSQADLVLSILPPAAAVEAAGQAAETMRRAGAAPAYADCNAVSPATTRKIAATIAGAGANFIDCGIVGAPPGRAVDPRFYVSGPDLGPMLALDGAGIEVKPVGREIGRASAIKMCYAALTKGTFTLHTAVLLAAETMGISNELHDEFRFSQKDAYARMQAMVPRLPADAGRWIGEMEEIASTFRDTGVSPRFHEGAAEIFRLLAATPLAAESRETIDPDRTLEQAVEIYAETLRRAGG